MTASTETRAEHSAPPTGDAGPRTRLTREATALRDADIRARYESGETLEAIGASYGFSRQRAQQIVDAPRKRRTGERVTREQASAARAASLEHRVRDALAANPTADPTTLSEAAHVAPAQVRKALGRDYTRLTVSTRPRENTFTHEQIMDALRTAAASTRSPLSMDRYTLHQRQEGNEGMPSAILVHTRYGSWTNALREAGLDARDPGERSWQRGWTREQALDLVVEYLSDPGSKGTGTGYDAWSREAPKGVRPGVQTVKHIVGPRWSVVKAEALERMARERQN